MEKSETPRILRVIIEDWSDYNYTQQINYRSVKIKLTEEQRKRIHLREVGRDNYEKIGNVFFEPEDCKRNHKSKEDVEDEIMDVATPGWEWWK